jgi:hypothetical protein
VTDLNGAKEPGPEAGQQLYAELEAGKAVSIGRHVITIPQKKGVVRMENHGDFELLHCILLHRVLEEVLRGHSRPFLLVLIKEPGTISAESRRWAAEWNRQHRTGGVAIVGTRTPWTFAMASMVVRASNMFRKEPLLLEFFRIEADAQAWIEHQQKLLE